jgi:integrase
MTRCCPKLGIHDPRKNFYSFRHTFKTGLARAGVDKPTRDYLCGHNDASAGAIYVHDISIEAMKQAIEKLQFDGFALRS